MFQRLIAGVGVLAVVLCTGSHAQSISPADVVLRAADARIVSGAWSLTSDAGASAGAALWLPDLGTPKLTSASATPRDFFELTCQVRAGAPYRLWFRSKAQNDSWTNDSAFVQFSGAVTSTGVPAFRIGTSEATVVSLEECSGCGESGWGWSDNGYGGDGPTIYFAADGAQTIRVQGREDGLIVDEIVLSPQKYLTSAPGTAKQDTTILPASDGSAPAPTVTLVRGPYLQRPSDRSVTVVWATRQSGSAEVRYQTPGGTLTAPATSHLVPNSATSLGYDYYQYEASLTGLAASSTYTYQPFVGGIAAASQASFRTAPPVGSGSVSFTGGGGAALYAFGTSPWTAYAASRYEYVRGLADGCTLALEGVGIDGVPFDGVSLSHCAPPPPAAGEIVLYAGTTTTRTGAWVAQPDATAAGGSFVIQPDASAPKITTPSANPANSFELAFDAVAGVPYRLWLRGRAQNDYYGNDSVFVQFSGSVDASGAAVWRIGSADATTVVLEDCGGCGEAGWGWQDNGYGTGVLGPVVYFTTTGPQRLRIQTREDGLGIDQVVLSPGRYLSQAPGQLKNDTTILTPSGGR